MADPLAEYEALEKLAKAATPGPWRHCVVNQSGFGDAVADTRVWLNGPQASDATQVRCDSPDKLGSEQKVLNAAFIAAANPTTVLALLAEIRALRADLERCHRAREQEYADGH